MRRFFKGAEATFRLVPGDAQILRRIWSAIVGNEFQNIETHQEIIYDRGGSTMLISHGGNTYEISDAGPSMIVRRDAAKWREIVAVVLAERDTILAHEGTPVTVCVGPELNNHRVSLSIGWHNILSDTLLRVPEAGLCFQFRIVPGAQVIRANIDLQQWADAHATIRISTTIRLGIREGKLGIEFQ